jgi:Kef-type K+ transport system membrane component KefB
MQEKLFVICLMVGGAALLPFLSRRLSVPSAVMEILYGMLVFHAAIHDRPEWLGFLKEVGFVYLMFIAGMELDIRALARNDRSIWYFVIPAVSLLLTPALFYLSGHSFYIGLALSMVSAGVAVPVLKEAGLVKEELGGHITGAVLAGELLSILALTGLDIYHRYGISLLSLLHTIKVVFLLLFAALALRLVYLAAWWNPGHVRKVMESKDPVEEGIRIALSIVFFGALIASFAGIEPIIGSFIAGVIFSYVFRNRSRFEEKINALGFGFFIPFFFMGVGADFDVGLLSSPLSVGTALFLAIVIFATNLSAVLLKNFISMGMKDALLMALLLSAPLSMVVAAGTLGTRMSIIDEREKNILVLATLFASLFYPFLFRLLTAKRQPQTSMVNKST